MANLTANNAAGGALGSFAISVPDRHQSADLPRLHQCPRRRRECGGLQRHDVDNTALTQDLVRTNPQPGNSAADLDGDVTRRANAAASACRRISSSSIRTPIR